MKNCAGKLLFPAQSADKSLAEFAPEGANRIRSIFPGDMCGGKNTFRPTNVRNGRLTRKMRALQRAASPSNENASEAVLI
jgi:hypothetical protein